MPGEPVVDFIFAGDSSMALVDEGLYADGTVKRTKRNVGEFLKAGRMDLLTEKAGSAKYSMHWGRGLKDITDGIEACLDNKLRRTPGGVAPAVIVVSYAGNDVYGNYGYVGNPWVDTQVLHRNPAKQQAAYAWQAQLAESHTQQMRRLADLRQRKDVAALIVICYCDGQSYGLPEDFTRQMILVSEAFKKTGVITVAGTTLVRSCARYDSFHCLNTDANRDLFVRYYASVALFAYYYWVLAGVDILRKDANLFAKQRGNKTRKALMRERVWNKRFEEGYLCLGDWYEPYPGEIRQHAITGTGKKVALTEFEEIAILDDWGEWEDAAQEEIEAARKLPFNVRAYQQRGTAGQWLIPTEADWGAPQASPKPKEDDKMEVHEPKVIEIDETFDPSTTTPPGTDGRDQNNQAPASAAGMEFVTANVPIPADGDKDVVPPEPTEEDELLVMNDPLDDEEQILELLEPHIAAAELHGHENVDQPDDDEDSMRTPTKRSCLTNLSSRTCLIQCVMKASRCKGYCISCASTLKSPTSSESTLMRMRSQSSKVRPSGNSSKLPNSVEELIQVQRRRRGPRFVQLMAHQPRERLKNHRKSPSPRHPRSPQKRLHRRRTHARREPRPLLLRNLHRSLSQNRRNARREPWPIKLLLPRRNLQSSPR